MRGYDPLKAALLLIPLPPVSSVMAPISGWLADRIGARTPATLGLLVQAAALVWLTRLIATTSNTVLTAGISLVRGEENRRALSSQSSGSN